VQAKILSVIISFPEVIVWKENSVQTAMRKYAVIHEIKRHPNHTQNNSLHHDPKQNGSPEFISY
jgi:hypothetical protein